MNKKWSTFMVLAILCLLAACSFAEADEVLEYHNDLVDYVNPRMDELQALNEKLIQLMSDEEALEMQKNEIIPILDDIQVYISSKSPEYAITKEYHSLRLNWINAFTEGVDLETEAVEGLLDGTLTEDEVWELILLSEEAVEESLRYDKEANRKWMEIQEEYNFEDVEE